MKSQVISSRERKVTLMVFLMVAAFVGAWSGYGTLCILRLVGMEFTSLSIGISMLIAKTGACLNPIIFIFLNNQVIESLKNCAQYPLSLFFVQKTFLMNFSAKIGKHSWIFYSNRYQIFEFSSQKSCFWSKMGTNLVQKKIFFWLNWTFVTLCIDAWKIFIFLGFAVLWGSHAQMVETINRQNHFSIQSSLGTLIWQKVYKGPKYPAVKYPDYRQFHNKRITKRTRG